MVWKMCCGFLVCGVLSTEVIPEVAYFWIFSTAGVWEFQWDFLTGHMWRCDAATYHYLEYALVEAFNLTDGPESAIWKS